MVQNENSNSGDDESTSGAPPAPAEIPANPAKGIEVGNYRMVGWGVDTTGRRLIDELCQIAAYSPNLQFAQYIMPFNDLNPIYSRKHNIRVVNTLRYRRLKDMKTNQYVKTKSEMSALTDFLQWLEDVKGDDCDGLILVYHEIRKAAPGMFLESLRRYNLIERFANVVKGFTNGFDVAQAKCHNTTKSFSLRIMSKVLLNKEGEMFNSAVERARASYNIAAHLAQGERQELVDEQASSGCTGLEPHIIEFICPFTNPISAEEDEIAGFKVLLERQNTFKPVFGAMLKASRNERQKASHLRRLLAVNNLDYLKLEQAFEKNAKEGLEKLIKNEIANAKKEELEELLEILDCFFDPEKKPIAPKPRFNNNNNNNRPKWKYNNNNNNKSKTTSESHSLNASSDNTESAENSPRAKEDEAVVDVVEQTKVDVEQITVGVEQIKIEVEAV